MKPSGYIETSVVSYLTARPSRDIAVATHQSYTWDFWEKLDLYQVYISELVTKEAGQGDAGAARKRLESIESLKLLTIDKDALVLSEKLISEKVMPANQPEDALHLAVATVNGLDIVLTWNYKHLNNPFTRMLTRQVIEDAGYHCPEICSPEELLEGENS
ncbi:MAG: type II toxin-antitoxin system VapC family toxin [Spirochaetales bacterium]|jgi:predicted nucleic acid-binding protein|nr:type II toxin-antitoxin system VapC family toxin [Spirochaetales bacterium]